MASSLAHASAEPVSFPTFFDSRTCIRKGICPVTTPKCQKELSSHALYFEQHGSGPQKILFIVGLNSTMFACKAQVDHFGWHGHYTLLMFDNRGVGNSGTPRGPYTTSAMAEDVIALLNHVGWKEERSIHVVGISLGGMIAQELATRIPERMKTLTLAVTSPGGRGWNNLPPVRLTVLPLSLADIVVVEKRHWFHQTLRLLAIPDPIKKIPLRLSLSFPAEWLKEKARDDEQGRTNEQVQMEASDKYTCSVSHLKFKKQWTQRLLLTPRQTSMGSASQMLAAFTHHVSTDRLLEMRLAVPRIVLVTGDDDWLVSPTGSERIWKAMRGDQSISGKSAGVVEFYKCEKTGHPIHMQRPDWFNALLESVFREGNDGQGSN